MRLTCYLLSSLALVSLSVCVTLICFLLLGVLAGGREIIEPSKVASCRKCLHLQCTSLTPELQASVLLCAPAGVCVRGCVCVYD